MPCNANSMRWIAASLKPSRRAASSCIDRANRELALYALDRAARVDPLAAHEGWVKWRNRMPEADRRYGNLLIAYNAARQLQPSRQRVVPRGRRRRDERSAARVADSRRAARRQLARCRACDRRNAGGRSAGTCMAVLESASVAGRRQRRGRDPPLRHARDGASFLRLSRRRGDRRRRHAGQRAACRRRRGDRRSSARVLACNGSCD